MRWLEAPGFSRDELDKMLKELVLLAQQHPPQSAKRQSALTKLHATILNSRKLWYPPKNRFNQYVYDEARQELWCYVCKYIEKYDPKKGSVIAWINTLLNTRFYPEAQSEYFKITSIQNNCIEISQSKENTLSLIEEVWEYIELDPENIFKLEHIKNHPEANFQALTKYRCSQITWEDISHRTRIKASTLNNFYQRCLKKFAPKIRKYLSY